MLDEKEMQSNLYLVNDLRGQAWHLGASQPLPIFHAMAIATGQSQSIYIRLRLLFGRQRSKRPKISASQERFNSGPHAAKQAMTIWCFVGA